MPDALAFSDFKGYESWQVVSVSQTDELLSVIVANPVMIKAYQVGIPGNGKPFPDGWGYALFNYDPASDRFTPEGTGAKCGNDWLMYDLRRAGHQRPFDPP